LNTLSLVFGFSPSIYFELSPVNPFIKDFSFDFSDPSSSILSG